MKNIKLFFIGLLTIFIGCKPFSKSDSQETIIKDFYKAFNESDFSVIDRYATDSIIYSEGEAIILNSKKDLYTHFQWDSVFKPEYNIIELKPVDDKFEATLSKYCTRIGFLHDTAMVSRVMITLNNNRITEIDIIDYEFFDFEKWQNQRNSLVTWIDENHPELSGFIFDQTLEGGLNYLKAIELYEGRE